MYLALIIELISEPINTIIVISLGITKITRDFNFKGFRPVILNNPEKS